VKESSPFTSLAVTWQDAAGDLLRAINQIETMSRPDKLAASDPALLVTVGQDLQSLTLQKCAADGTPTSIETAVQIRFPLLPNATDVTRDDDIHPANASIDRAVCKAAAEMLSWTKDPDTLELIEHRRYWLFVLWPTAEPTPVNEYAYGLWDE
jgi:hypothetical protein